MPLTKYDGRTDAVAVASNFTLVIVPAVTWPAVKATEVEATGSLAIQCAITTWGVTPQESTQTEQYLCDKIASETAGAVRYSIEPLTILAGDPQEQNAIVSALPPNTIVYLVERRGVSHDTTFALGDIVSVVKAEVIYCVPAPVTANENGDKFNLTAKFAVKDYLPFVTLAA